MYIFLYLTYNKQELEKCILLCKEIICFCSRSYGMYMYIWYVNVIQDAELP